MAKCVLFDKVFIRCIGVYIIWGCVLSEKFSAENLRVQSKKTFIKELYKL